MDWTITYSKSLLQWSIILLLLGCQVWGQSVRIQVTDRETHSPVPNAIIHSIPQHLEQMTDTRGTAQFFIDPHIDTLQFIVIRIDYDTLTTRIPSPNQDTTLYLGLHPRPIAVESVTTVYDRALSSRAGIFHLDSLHLRQSPLIMNDPMRMLQWHPSTINTTDYTSYYFVRGGSPDQNLFYIDDIFISNPYRLRIALGGGLSMLNSRLIQSVTFFPGVFSVAYGGQQASLVNIRTRVGNKDEHHLNLSLNPLEGEIHFEGPLGKGIRINTAFRRSLIGEVTKLLFNNPPIDPVFGDFQGNMYYPITPRQSVKLGWFIGNERVQLTLRDESVIGTEGISETRERFSLGLFHLLHRWEITPHVFLKNVIAYKEDSNNSHYQFIASDSSRYNSNPMLLKSRQKQIEFRQVFVYHKQNFQLKSGWGFKTGTTRFNVENGAIQYHILGDLMQQDSLFTGETFSEIIWQFSSRWQLQTGIRSDFFSFYPNAPRISPRGKIIFQPVSSLQIFGAAGIFYQFPYLESMLYRIPPPNLYGNTSPGEPFFPRLSPEKFFKWEWGVFLNLRDKFQLHGTLFSIASENMLESYRNDVEEIIVTRNSGKFRSRGVEIWLNWQPEVQRFVPEVFLSASWHQSKQLINKKWLPAYGDATRSLLFKMTVPKKGPFFISTQMVLLDEQTLFSNNAKYYIYYLENEENQDRKYQTQLYNKGNTYFRWDLRVGTRISSAIHAYLDFVNLTNRRNLFHKGQLLYTENSQSYLKEFSIYNFPFFMFVGVEWKLL